MSVANALPSSFIQGIITFGWNTVWMTGPGMLHGHSFWFPRVLLKETTAVANVSVITLCTMVEHLKSVCRRERLREMHIK